MDYIFIAKKKNGSIAKTQLQIGVTNLEKNRQTNIKYKSRSISDHPPFLKSAKCKSVFYLCTEIFVPTAQPAQNAFDREYHSTSVILLKMCLYSVYICYVISVNVYYRSALVHSSHYLMMCNVTRTAGFYVLFFQWRNAFVIRQCHTQTERLTRKRERAQRIRY